MAFTSFYALTFGDTAVYNHMWGISANDRIRAINIGLCLAVNPCFVPGKNGFKWKICPKKK